MDVLKMKNPILVIGIGGYGSRIIEDASSTLNSDRLVISNDSRDLTLNDKRCVHIPTNSVINPSVRLIRGETYNAIDKIRSEIAPYPTVIMMCNLAGKAGVAMSPVISQICKESGKKLVSFAVMPFKYEKDRIFDSGISLKRVRENSDCTIVLDNDSLLENNPDLNQKQCYKIANSAINYVLESLKSEEPTPGMDIITTGRDRNGVIEDSLKDSLKMLYSNTVSSAVKRSIFYVVGGDNIPVGMLGSITSLAEGIINKDTSQVRVMSSTNESKVVMLSSIQGMTKFDKYDPLGVIPEDKMLDWKMPDCSIDYKMNLYQMEQ